MLEYQQSKAQKLREATDDPAAVVREYTRWVRGRIESVQSIKPDARVLEVGSGAHGLIFFFGSFGPVRGVGIDPLARVLTPSGLLYFEVNVSHPIYGLLSRLYGLWKAMGVAYEIPGFAEHTAHFHLGAARRLVTNLPFRIIWESYGIPEMRATFETVPRWRMRDWVRRLFYLHVRFEAIAVREPACVERARDRELTINR